MGPMTGRGMGPCGQGMGYGQGYGRGYGRNYLTRNEEVSELKEEAEALKSDLKAVEERIAELGSGE